MCVCLRARAQDLHKSLITTETGPRNELADAIVRLPMKTASTLADGGRPLSLIRREAPFQIMYIMAAVDISKYGTVTLLPDRVSPSCVHGALPRTHLAKPCALAVPCAARHVCVFVLGTGRTFAPVAATLLCWKCRCVVSKRTATPISWKCGYVVVVQTAVRTNISRTPSAPQIVRDRSPRVFGSERAQLGAPPCTLPCHRTPSRPPTVCFCMFPFPLSLSGPAGLLGSARRRSVTCTGSSPVVAVDDGAATSCAAPPRASATSQLHLSHAVGTSVTPVAAVQGSSRLGSRVSPMHSSPRMTMLCGRCVLPRRCGVQGLEYDVFVEVGPHLGGTGSSAASVLVTPPPCSSLRACLCFRVSESGRGR